MGRASGNGEIAAPPGVLPQARDELVLPGVHDIEASVQAIEEQAETLAAVIVEPVMGAGGLIPAGPRLPRILARGHQRLGVVLIFDEMISFSIARGGAQEYYGVLPDMTTTGKCAGGGMPIGDFCAEPASWTS